MAPTSRLDQGAGTHANTVLRGSVSVALLATIAGTASGQARPAGRGACPPERVSAAYAGRVEQALLAKQDVWGNALLASPGGPTYERVRRYLKPLLLVGRPAGTKGRLLTDSGVYYLAFGQPSGPRGTGSFALHVADGSQIVSDRADGPSLTVKVGAERYGSCRSRLGTPALFGGYLPILETRYVDAAGVRYRQESFAARIPETRSLVSFVRLTADARQSALASVRLRFTPSAAGLAAAGDRLVHGKDTYLFFSPGGTFDGSALTYTVQRQEPLTVYLAWLDQPAPSQDLALDQTSYEQARSSVADYWAGRLAEGTTFVVPEQRVLDAERSLLIQNLEMTWRYSVGNDYEMFSYPESVDEAQVLGEYGFQSVARAILRTSLTKTPNLYPNWEQGEKLVGAARYYRLFGDRRYVDEETPALARYVADLGRQLPAEGPGILHRERYSADIPLSVYGFHSQAVAWQGLRAMAQVWALTGHPGLAQRSRGLAARLEAGLRAAVRSSERRLPGGSLFIPAQLLGGEAPYDALTATKLGSYWNLVTPYALASGLLAPHGPEAAGVLSYLLNHGSRLLGLVRFNYYPVRVGSARPRGAPGYRTSGSDDVYGVNVARFLADNDQPDQLVLSLYGKLAAGMTEGTFVAGEGSTIAPVPGEAYRSMYLPPNSVSNAFFLETLRLMLVHETSDGLELAYATPRAWLRSGRSIVVHEAPTSFGPVSYSIQSGERSVQVQLTVPSLRTLRLRLRLPGGKPLTGVSLDGRPYRRFGAATETIDLSGLRGSHELVAHYGTRSASVRQMASRRAVRVWKIHYRSHDGVRRAAYVLLPAWYGPKHNPPIPLIISPHGRGQSGRDNVRIWGHLPAEGSFAVVNPDGQGRRLGLYSWGYAGQIADLAKMPQLARKALPWLRIDPRRIYAFGGSMGGQETLLLAAQNPRLLAGAAAFDSVADLALQYRRFRLLGCGSQCRRRWGASFGAGLQALARLEVGGSPATRRAAYSGRSPLGYARRLAFSCVPLQLWWSVADRIVIDEPQQSGKLFSTLRRLNPEAPVQAFVGSWAHSIEMDAHTRLPFALETFGLLPVGSEDQPADLHVLPAVTPFACTRGAP